MKKTRLPVIIVPLLAQVLFAPWNNCPDDRLPGESDIPRRNSLYVRIGEDGKRKEFTKCKEIGDVHYRCGKLKVTWSGDFERGRFDITLTDDYSISYAVNNYECVRGGPGTKRSLETIATPQQKEMYQRGGWRYTEEYKLETKKCYISKVSGDLYYTEIRLLSPPLSPLKKEDTSKKLEILEVTQDIRVCKKKPILSL